MTFPNDFHRHPKVARLSVEARWAFVEMNGEARLADNDGIFPEGDAEFMWGRELLAELVASHPTRPLVVHGDGTYRIRDYADHQQTRAEREELRAKRSEAGRKGGLANSQASAKQVLSRSEQTQAESESTDFYSPSKSQSLGNRARVSTDAIEVSPMTKRLAGQIGITSLRSVVDAVGRHCDITITADQAYQLSAHILGKAPGDVPAPQRYVLGSVEKNPFEVQKHIYEAMEVA